MGVVAHSAPNFAGAMQSLGVSQGPIVKSAFTHLPLFSNVNGIMQMVFAYGGAMIFPEFMAEMRRPKRVLISARARQLAELLRRVGDESYRPSSCLAACSIAFVE